MTALTPVTTARLPDLGPAPELGNSTWLNTDLPLRLADRRGQVVGLEMWTFGCINCQHVIPSVKQWHAAYKEQGFVPIGNHHPEFSYEQDLGNLKQAVCGPELSTPWRRTTPGQPGVRTEPTTGPRCIGLTGASVSVMFTSARVPTKRSSATYRFCSPRPIREAAALATHA